MLCMADTHFTLAFCRRYQFSNMHLAPLFELHWLGGAVWHISSFFITTRTDDLMIFPSCTHTVLSCGARCGELLRCLTPVTFYYFTVINLARMQTLYWNGWNITSASQAERERERQKLAGRGNFSPAACQGVPLPALAWLLGQIAEN
jgi:hypothetical protein